MLTNPKDFIAKPSLAKELDVSSRTISRWMGDPALAFPAPIRLRGRLYFSRADLTAWKQERFLSAVGGAP